MWPVVRDFGWRRSPPMRLLPYFRTSRRRQRRLVKVARGSLLNEQREGKSAIDNPVRKRGPRLARRGPVSHAAAICKTSPTHAPVAIAESFTAPARPRRLRSRSPSSRGPAQRIIATGHIVGLPRQTVSPQAKLSRFTRNRASKDRFSLDIGRDREMEAERAAEVTADAYWRRQTHCSNICPPPFHGLHYYAIVSMLGVRPTETEGNLE